MKAKSTGISLNNSKIKCPCMNCDMRYEGCHSICKAYLKYEKEKRGEYSERALCSKTEHESPNYRDGWQFRRKRGNV